jgi:hypothetical protein
MSAISLHRLRPLAVLALTLSVFAFAGCDSSEDTPTTGTITGTITLPQGAGGDIVNTRVALFESLDEFDSNLPTFTTATDANGTFSFENVNPDSYFIAAWKDNNNSGDIDGGDYFGVIGTNQIEGFVPSRQQVVAGENTGFNVTILILPPGFGIDVAGTYAGTNQPISVNLTLTNAGTAVTGTGTISDGVNNFSVTVSGSFNAPNVNLSMTSPQLQGPVTLTGTVSDDGRTINATLNGSGLNNFTITLNRQ